MGFFNKLAREDGFYAGNLFKSVDGEDRYSFIIIIFISDYIFYQLEQTDEPIAFNSSIIPEIKAQHYETMKSIQSGKIKRDELPTEASIYTETPESLKAEFQDGTDKIKITLYPRLFSGVLLDIEIEGLQFNWLNLTNIGVKSRKVIDKAKLKFYSYK